MSAPGTLAYIKGSACIVREQLASIPEEAGVAFAVEGVWSDLGKLFEITGGISLLGCATTTY